MFELNAHKQQVDLVIGQAEKTIEAITGQKVKVRVDVVIELKGPQREKVLKETICLVCQVEWTDLLKYSREKGHSEARHLFCWFAYNWLEYSYKAVGKMLSGRDHTTAIHSCQTVQNLLDSNDKQMTEKFNEIQRIISKRLS